MSKGFHHQGIALQSNYSIRKFIILEILLFYHPQTRTPEIAKWGCNKNFDFLFKFEFYIKIEIDSINLVVIELKSYCRVQRQ